MAINVDKSNPFFCGVRYTKHSYVNAKLRSVRAMEYKISRTRLEGKRTTQRRAIRVAEYPQSKPWGGGKVQIYVLQVPPVLHVVASHFFSLSFPRPPILACPLSRSSSSVDPGSDKRGGLIGSNARNVLLKKVKDLGRPSNSNSGQFKKRTWARHCFKEQGFCRHVERFPCPWTGLGGQGLDRLLYCSPLVVTCNL